MSKPVAVLISDIHYNLNTLPLADAAMRQAITKANELEIPVIIAGDMHDTKANLRGECVKAILDTFATRKTPFYVLVGNHDRLNEKAPAHSLEFLRGHCMLVEEPVARIKFKPYSYMIPYYNDPNELRDYLKNIPKGSVLIMHQGIAGSNSGDYIQDKSAIRPEDVAGMRVISGHYHTRQTIALPDGGKWDYIGNPYTLNFAEANDPEKGFQILMDDGTLEFVSTNLRKHITIDFDLDDVGMSSYKDLNPDDLVKVRLMGTRSQISQMTKEVIVNQLDLCIPFKIESVPDDSDKIEAKITASKPELLDSIIDNTGEDSETKTRLKQVWRDLCV